MVPLLDPDALTIGFARRFTGYKRASLIFHDYERIKKIMLNPWRPVQIVFAGKAHPADEHGKHLIHQIYSLAADSDMAGHTLNANVPARFDRRDRRRILADIFVSHGLLRSGL